MFSNNASRSMYFLAKPGLENQDSDFANLI